MPRHRLALAIASFAILATGCTSSSTTEPTGPVPGPTAGPTTPAPAPAPTPTPAPAPTPTPAPAQAALQLRLAAPAVDRGQSVALFVDNTGASDFVFHHPGASNGCGRFRWVIDLVHEGGVHYSNDYSGPDMVCTMAIVPPSDITVAVSKPAELRIDTSARWYVTNAKGGIAGQAVTAPLQPGNYRVVVRGVGVPLQTALTVR